MGKFMYKFVNVFNNDWKIMQEFKREYIYQEDIYVLHFLE